MCVCLHRVEVLKVLCIWPHNLLIKLQQKSPWTDPVHCTSPEINIKMSLVGAFCSAIVSISQQVKPLKKHYHVTWGAICRLINVTAIKSYILESVTRYWWNPTGPLPSSMNLSVSVSLQTHFSLNQKYIVTFPRNDVTFNESTRVPQV